MQHLRPRLPLDICLRIIDAIRAEDSSDRIKTLSACALTSRAWLPRVRVHLYQDVRGLRENQLLPFLRTIAASPELGQLVQLFGVHFESCPSLIWYPPYKSKHRKPQSAPIFVALRQALPRFTRLDWLSFHSKNLYPCDEMLLFVKMFSAVKTVRDLELESLVFEGFCDLVKLVNPFVQLERLAVSSCNWIDLPVPQPLDLTKGRALRFLEFEQNLYEHGLLSVCPSTVDTLHLGPPTYHFERNEEDPDEDYKVLSRYTDLETLSLRASLFQPGTPYANNNWLEWLPEALSNVRSMNVSNFDIPLKIYAEGAQLDSLRALIDRSHLLRIDEILSSGSFPNLCVAHITLEVYDLEDLELWEAEREGLVDDLAASFPKCPGAGIDVSITAWECPAP